MHGSTASFIGRETLETEGLPVLPSPLRRKVGWKNREFAARAKRRATSYATLSLDGNRRVVQPSLVQVLVRAKSVINFPLGKYSRLSLFEQYVYNIHVSRKTLTSFSFAVHWTWEKEKKKKEIIILSIKCRFPRGRLNALF